MRSDSDDPRELEAAVPARTTADRIYLAILIVLQLVMAAEFFFLLFDQQWLNALLVAGIMAMIVAPVLLTPRLRVKIPAEFQLLTVIFVFATLFLGEILRYYDRYDWWDTALHGGSGLLMGIFGFLLVYVMNENRSIDLQLRPGFVAFFSFLFATSVETLWEIFEFAMDELFGYTMQNGELGDTMWDLVSGTAGAAAICIFGWWYLRRPERSFIERWVQKFIARNPRLFRS